MQCAAGEDVVILTKNQKLQFLQLGLFILQYICSVI